FLNGIRGSGVGSFRREVISIYISPEVQTALALARAYRLSVFQSGRYRNFPKFIGRHQLDGIDSQIFPIGNSLLKSPEGSPESPFQPGTFRVSSHMNLI